MLAKARALWVALLLVGGVAAFGADSEPASPPDREQLARKVMELTGSGDLGRQLMHQLVAIYRQQNQGLPEDFWDEFVASVDMKQLEAMIIPIYVETFTAEELSAMVEFYGSPVGQSVIGKMPLVLQQSMHAGQKWGEELGREVIERLDGYKQAHPP